MNSVSISTNATNCKLDMRSENIAKKTVLSTDQIEASVQHFLPFYSEGTRDKFAFSFSGFAFKEDIAEESASKILENICVKTNDVEKNARLETLHRTYVNGLENGYDGITDKTKLKEVIVAFTEIGNNLVYLHGLHFPASFLYMYQI